MLTILIIAAIIGYVFAVPSPEKKTTTVVERHHHHTTVVVRPVYVEARILLIQAQIDIDDAKRKLEPVRVPEARALLNPSTAIERYRSQERKPS